MQDELTQTETTTDANNGNLNAYLDERNAEITTTDPRVIRAYQLQEQVKQAKAHYEDLQTELRELLSEVGPYKNDYYAVTNLKRAPRKIDMDLLRQNFPELVEKATPSDKYLIQALEEEFGKETLLKLARDHNPEEFDRARNLSISDFDKLTGDSSKAYKFVGKAYLERWIEDKSEPLTITYLGSGHMDQFKPAYDSDRVLDARDAMED